MIKRIIPLLLFAVTMSGCLASYRLVPPGTSTVGNLMVKSSATWNQAPRMASSRKNTQVWTQDGLLLDRIIIIPGVPDDETLFITRQKDAALPKFRSDMLPNEIEELSESSITKLFGEGEVTVATRKLRPHRFGENQGFMFDLSVVLADGPDYSGMVGAFVADEMLYMILYIAAEPYYFGKHADEAAAIIKTAHL